MKKTKRVKLDALLLNILKMDSFNGFTIIELRDVYVSKSDKRLCPLETRKFLYKQILRLVKLDILLKNGAKNSQKTTYLKAERFKFVVFEEIQNDLSISSVTSSLQKENELPFNNIALLKGTLREYKVDMISAIGESEEYKRLGDIFPEMKASLKQQYYESRNKSSRLLGQIKAIETAIKMTEASLSEA